MNIEKHKVYIMTIIFLFVSLLLLILLNPINAKAEEFYNGSYITYYQDEQLQNAHLNAYGVYFVNDTAYTTNTSNFKNTWFYTTHLDVSNIRGGSIYIPYTFGFLPPTDTYNTVDREYTYACSNYAIIDCNQGTGICYKCTSYQSSQDNSTQTNEFSYDFNSTFIIRCYYDGTVSFVPGRVEGSNIICPVQKGNTSFLYGIRVFHRVIGKNAWSYSFGLAAGITTYSSTATQIIEAQQATTNAIQDSSTNTNNENSSAISGLENNIGTNGTIQSLAVMPITLFQSMLNSINGTCSPFYIGSLFGTEVSFACVDLESFLGSSLWALIDVLCCGLFIWTMANKLRKVWDSFTNLNHKDEVGDL